MNSFYDVKGNEISKDGIVAQFINNYTGNLTDFNEGSEIRNLLEAFAVYAMGNEERMNDLVYTMDIMNADGEALDIIAGQPQIDMERIEGIEATGDVLFTVQNALVEELLVPAGTIVSAENGMDFETITDNVLMPGEMSMTCTVQAIDVGADGNIPAHSIITKIDGYDAIGGFTVDNPDPFIGGLEFEEDDAFRDRILEHLSLQKFGSKPYYIATLANEYSDAHDILFTSATGYTAKVIPNTYKGADAQTSLVNDVTSFLSNENNILMGHTFDVVSPTAKPLKVYVSNNSSFTPSESTCMKVLLTSPTDENVARVKEFFEKYIGGGALSDKPIEYRGLNLNETLEYPSFEEAFKEALGDIIAITSPVWSPSRADVVSLTGYDKYECTVTKWSG